MMVRRLERQTFEIDRDLEYFSDKELQLQIGYARPWWALALVKELIDNSLDACENAEGIPTIEVVVDPDSFTVIDNGPGIPQETVAASLNYRRRVTDKLYYVSPTRGQLGNALKVLWAAPFVAHGSSHVEVWAQGVHHRIQASLDRIAQKPRIEHERNPCSVKSGTTVKVGWPDSTSSLFAPPSYAGAALTVRHLVASYAAFNPHATFILNGKTHEATDLQWRKWRPDNPTSPHWYTEDNLRDLVAAYINGQNGAKGRTVREFVSEFRGLSGTAKQKRVTGPLTGKYLADLVVNGDVDLAAVRRLLCSMRAEATPPKPAMLGIIGKGHLAQWMVRHGVAEDSVRYTKKAGEDAGLPYVLEVAFGIRANDDERRQLITGLNWSPAIGSPIPELQEALGGMRVDTYDSVTVVFHLARPRLAFVDRGKARVQI